MVDVEDVEPSGIDWLSAERVLFGKLDSKGKGSAPEEWKGLIGDTSGDSSEGESFPQIRYSDQDKPAK